MSIALSVFDRRSASLLQMLLSDGITNCSPGLVEDDIENSRLSGGCCVNTRIAHRVICVESG